MSLLHHRAAGARALEAAAEVRGHRRQGVPQGLRHTH